MKLHKWQPSFLLLYVESHIKIFLIKSILNCILNCFDLLAECGPPTVSSSVAPSSGARSGHWLNIFLFLFVRIINLPRGQIIVEDMVLFCSSQQLSQFLSWTPDAPQWAITPHSFSFRVRNVSFRAQCSISLNIWNTFYEDFFDNMCFVQPSSTILFPST